MPLIYSIQNSDYFFSFSNALDRCRIDARSIVGYKGDIAEHTITVHLPTGKEKIDYSSGESVILDVERLEEMMERVLVATKDKFSIIIPYSTDEDAMQAFDRFDHEILTAAPDSLVSLKEHTINVSEIRHATRSANVILIYLKNVPQVSNP